MDTAAVVAILKTAVAKAGGQRAWSRSAGLSEQYVADVLQGRRAPGPRILAGLGLRRVVYYAPAREEARS